jgi:hypothetical protein
LFVLSIIWAGNSEGELGAQSKYKNLAMGNPVADLAHAGLWAGPADTFARSHPGTISL